MFNLNFGIKGLSYVIPFPRASLYPSAFLVEDILLYNSKLENQSLSTQLASD
jgi:hypothetical protein